MQKFKDFMQSPCVSMTPPFQQLLPESPKQKHVETSFGTNIFHHRETSFSCPGSRRLGPSDHWFHSRRSTSLNFGQLPNHKNDDVNWRISCKSHLVIQGLSQKLAYEGPVGPLL